MGIGDWGLGIGDLGIGPIPNPQSPIPNPQSSIQNNLKYIVICNKIKFLKKRLIFFLLFISFSKFYFK